MTLNISVIDRSTNRGLLGLAQSEFKLFEDGQEQRIVQFESSSAPFDLMLLIDFPDRREKSSSSFAPLRFVLSTQHVPPIASV